MDRLEKKSSGPVDGVEPSTVKRTNVRQTHYCISYELLGM